MTDVTEHTVTTQPSVEAMVRAWDQELRAMMAAGLYGVRVQFAAGDGELAGTLFYNAKGGFVATPGKAPVSVDEWLEMYAA